MPELLAKQWLQALGTLQLPLIMPGIPKTESIGSIASKEWTLYCPYSLFLGIRSPRFSDPTVRLHVDVE